MFHSNDGKIHTNDRVEIENYRDSKGIGFHGKQDEEKMRPPVPQNKMLGNNLDVNAIETEQKKEKEKQRLIDEEAARLAGEESSQVEGKTVEEKKEGGLLTRIFGGRKEGNTTEEKHDGTTSTAEGTEQEAGAESNQG